MARIAGVNIPDQKKVFIALTYIYGIGRHNSSSILGKANISPDIRVKDLSEDQVRSIREIVDGDYSVEGDLRTEVSMNIKRKIGLRTYAGSRHLRKLPLRGQRTRANARTRRGKAVAIAGKKKVTK